MPDAPSAARTDDGSALVVALVAVTLAMTLAGVLVLYASARRTLVRREVHRVETDYAAEAAAYVALARLTEQPDWRPVEGVDVSPDDALLPRGRGLPTREDLRVRARGLYIELTAEATWGTTRSVSARAGLLAGRLGANAFPAIAFGDTLLPLTLAAGTSVRGTIRTGLRGAQTATLSGRPFDGRLEGDRDASPGSPLPDYDDRTATETLARARRDLAAVPDSLPPRLAPAGPTHPAWAEERLYDPDAAVYQIGPDARLGSSDSVAVRAATHVLATGDLRLGGPLRLRPWTTLFVQGRLTVSGEVSAEHVLVVAERVTVEGPVRLQGQILVRRALSAIGGARFPYPSVLYGPADPLGEDDALTVGRAQVEGVVLVPPGLDNPETVRLTLAPEAVVRGLVYSARTADVQGRVEGTLAVQRTRFYDSPAVYVGWLRGLVVDRQARPDPFVLPFGFGTGLPTPAAQRRWSWAGERLAR